jgi:septation ring formation regulator EzrA
MGVMTVAALAAQAESTRRRQAELARLAAHIDRGYHAFEADYVASVERQIDSLNSALASLRRDRAKLIGETEKNYGTLHRLFHRHIHKLVVLEQRIGSAEARLAGFRSAATSRRAHVEWDKAVFRFNELSRG